MQRRFDLIGRMATVLFLPWVLGACTGEVTEPAPTAAPTVIPVATVDTQAPPAVKAPTETESPAEALTPTVAIASPRPTGSSTPYTTPPAPGQPALIPILMYHHVQVLGANPTPLQRQWTVSPEQFGRQLDYLIAHGYHTVSFTQLVAFLEDGQALPSRPILLTFDDGWAEDYAVAFPALRQRSMIATFFVPTSYADSGSKTVLNWKQIAEMDAAGMEFGGHTLTHANLTKVPAEEATRQLLLSKSRMEHMLGHATTAFDYPYGAANAQVIELVRQAGYRAAVGLCCGYRLYLSSIYLLPRMLVTYEETLDQFIKQLPPEAPY